MLCSSHALFFAVPSLRLVMAGAESALLGVHVGHAWTAPWGLALASVFAFGIFSPMKVSMLMRRLNFTKYMSNDTGYDCAGWL